MAFTASQKLEPVRFGDFELMPILTTELRMRISTLRFQTESEYEQAKCTIAKAFPNDEAKVKDFMDKNIFPNDLARLATYLVAGASGVEQLDQRMKYAMEKEIDRMLEKQEKESHE